MMKMMKMKKKKIAAGSRSISSSTIDIEANFVDHVELTEDLILEILSHLPPACLLRFKSVSKTWYSHISNPDFLCRNTANQFDKRWRRSINDHPSSILLKRYELAGDSRMRIINPFSPCPLLPQKLIDYRPDGYKKGKSFMLLDSCNGLLLYRNSVQYEYNLYVCNPITHDYIKLPNFRQEEREQGFKIVYDYSSPNIVFDPSVSLTYKVVIWLKCSSTTIDHKTISSSSRLEEEEEEKRYRFYVYSSVTRSWKLSVSTNQFPVPHGQFNCFFQRRVQRVLCNGVLYWSSTKCKHFFHTNVSLRYDVEKDVISTLNFPKMPPEYSNRHLLYFGECGGHLRMIEKYYTDKEVQGCGWLIRGLGYPTFPAIFDVMELEDNNNDDLWTVKYRVNFEDGQVGRYFDEVIRKYHPDIFGIHILDLCKTKTKKKEAGEHDEIDQVVEEEEEQLLLNIDDICIIPFNLSSNTFGKNKNSAGERFLGCSFTDILRYDTITLFPPSSVNQCRI